MSNPDLQRTRCHLENALKELRTADEYLWAACNEAEGVPVERQIEAAQWAIREAHAAVIQIAESRKD